MAKTDEEAVVSMAKDANIYNNKFEDQSGMFVIHNHVPGEIVRQEQQTEDDRCDSSKCGCSGRAGRQDKTLWEKVRETPVGEVIDTVMGKK